MRDHSTIITDAAKGTSEAAVSRLIGGGVKPFNVGDWRRRNLIPAERWQRLVELGLTTYDELAAHVAAPTQQAA
jgi:hypothetical protein